MDQETELPSFETRFKPPAPTSPTPLARFARTSIASVGV
jgi:hypothetical protein